MTHAGALVAGSWWLCGVTCAIGCGGVVDEMAGEAGLDATMDTSRLTRDGAVDARRDAPRDASRDESRDAIADVPSDRCDAGGCADCGTPDLASFCETDAGNDCPPGLDAPDYEVWLTHHVEIPGGYPSYEGCFELPCCRSSVYVAFQRGVDCEEYFLFDRTTGELIAGETACGSGFTCTRAHTTSCVDDPCIPNISRPAKPSSRCPALPAPGVDAATD